MSGTELEIPQTMHIDTSAETETAPEVENRELSPRERQMAEIAARREEAINRELAHGVTMENEARLAGGGEVIEPDPEDAPDPEPQPAMAAPPAGPPASHAAPQPAPEPTLRRVTVGGQQFNVTDAQYEHLASIGAIASLAMQQQAPQPQPAQPVHAQAPAPEPTTDRAKLAETWRKMSYGSEEDGIAALQDLIATVRPAQQVDPQQVAHQATQQTLHHIQTQNNLMTVAREYADIFGPSDRQHTPEESQVFATRGRLAAIELHEIRQRDMMLGNNRSDLEVYREAAQRVRAAIGGGAQQPQPATQASATQPAVQAAPKAAVSVDAERLERKRAAPRTPQAVGRTAGAAQAMGARPPTASETVAWMAKTRGQQTPVRMP